MCSVRVQELALRGKAGFYEGRVAEAVVDVVRENGGVMSLDDMKNHVTAEITPIHTDYKVGEREIHSDCGALPLQPCPFISLLCYRLYTRQTASPA